MLLHEGASSGTQRQLGSTLKVLTKELVVIPSHAVVHGQRHPCSGDD